MRKVTAALAAASLTIGFHTWPTHAAQVSNSVVTLEVSGAHGGAIDSFRVVGTETVDANDMGRNIQASVIFPYNATSNHCGGPLYNFVNPQEGGDTCLTPSSIYAIGTTGARLDVGTYPLDWGGQGTLPGLRIEGHHTVGPLAYSSHPEVTEVTYALFSDQSSLTPTHTFTDDVGSLVPIPLLPAMYLKADTLTQLWGLSMDGTTWVDLSSSVASYGYYHPSLYRFRAMAWMKPDLGWGVAVYGRWTMDQSCPTSYPMALPDQQGQCPNFVAQRFPNASGGAVNNLSLVDQTLGTIPAGTGVQVRAHIVVGNLGTIQSFVNEIYNAGH